MAKIETALLSVSDKTGLPAFARRLAALGINLISTGGTARVLRQRGVETQEVADYTGIPDILDGRIKTLHHKLHAGLLALRDSEEHRRQMREHDIRPIDMVVVNLYPLSDILTETSFESMRGTENIDIGGPTLIRSAAKNYTHVAVVTDPATYDDIADELERNNGALCEETHFRLALAAFDHTAHYDRAIAEYLAGIHGDREGAPERLIIELTKKCDLPCGENPHQAAALYAQQGVQESGVATARQLGGPPLTYIGALDVSAGAELVKELNRAGIVLMRRGAVYAGGAGESIEQACRRALQKVSRLPHGCAAVANRTVDLASAQGVLEVEPDVLAAPGFEPDALDLLREQTDGPCLLQTGPLNLRARDQRLKDLRGVLGGLLAQDRNLFIYNARAVQTVAGAPPTPEQTDDARLAWTCAKHARSSACALVRAGSLVGCASGQPTAEEALSQAVQQAGDAAAGAVLALDEPPCNPGVFNAAAEAGVAAVIEPGGSQADRELVQTAKQLGLTMVFTGPRHLRM